MTTALVQILRIVAVVALLCVAAALATPPGRLPLALRGLAKMLGRRPAADGGGRRMRRGDARTPRQMRFRPAVSMRLRTASPKRIFTSRDSSFRRLT